MDLKQFLSAVNQIAEEKGISKDKVIETIEAAIAAAYKKDHSRKGEVVKVKLDMETGRAKINQVLLVVDEDMIKQEEEEEKVADKEESEGEKKTVKEEESEDEEQKIKFNPKRHIMLKDAKKIKKNIKPGDELEMPLEEYEEYGRIAAQTAKQVIIQKIREAEREAVFDEYKDKEGEIISGLVQRVEKGTVFMDIGRATGVLFPEEQIPSERYRIGERLRVYVIKVEKEVRGSLIFLSRRHPKMISKLFELEVPEISEGIVAIKAIAREAGSRTKIAVASEEEGVDPVGSCVGQKGTRVSAVINELNGENIDIIEWDDNISKFIANSLSPAKVLNIEIFEDKNEAVAEVAGDQLSLAIGKKGQNVRLAAKLTGWKIDVRDINDKEKQIDKKLLGDMDVEERKDGKKEKKKKIIGKEKKTDKKKKSAKKQEKESAIEEKDAKEKPAKKSSAKKKKEEDKETPKKKQ